MGIAMPEGAEFLLRTEEVAKWLAVSKSTLVRWRQSGSGPDVYWLSDGVPRYRWLSGRTAMWSGLSRVRSAHAHSAR
jgi:hypothetical protein